MARTVFNDTLLDPQRIRIEGTAPYMSPAKARGEVEDTRGDIYSLGALFYESLTGTPPYSGDTREQVVKQILAGSPPPILEVNPNASSALARIAQHAMGRELCNRYPRVEDMVADLDRAPQGDAPLRTPSPSIAPRLVAPRFGRHRRLALAGSLCLAALLGLFGFWQHWIAGRQPTLKLLRQLSIPGVWAWNNAMPGDLQGDGEPGLLTVASEELLAVSSAGEIVGTWRVPDFGTDLLAVDLVTNVLGDGKDEVLVSWRQGTNVTIAVLNHNLFPVRRFLAQGSLTTLLNGRVSKSSLHAAAVADLDQDDRRELVAALNTGYGKGPHGLCCFDFEDGTLKWQYLTGPSG